MMTDIHMSPKATVTTTPVYLDFFQTLHMLLNGARATRVEWDDADTFILVFDSRLKIHKDDGKLYDLIVSTGDMIAKDWVVI